MWTTAETKVPPDRVWRAWNVAHRLDTNGGQVQTQGRFKYQIVDIKKGEGFSILWRTLFVKLLLTYRVQALYGGSQISYRVQVKGLFAWLVRWVLQRKLKEDSEQVLRQMVEQLERI
jgi:hypothetical protein